MGTRLTDLLEEALTTRSRPLVRAIHSILRTVKMMTMMEAHDRFYLEESDFDRTIAIDALGVGTTEFGMRRIRLVLTVALVMAAMVVGTAAPALAAGGGRTGCNQNETFCGTAGGGNGDAAGEAGTPG